MFNRKKKLFGMFRKKSKLEKFYYKNEEFIKYCLVSVLCTGILYLVFFLVDLITNGNYLIANFFSYTISFLILFLLDQKIFKSKPRRKKDKVNQILTFIIVRIIGFPLDSFLLSFFIKSFSLSNMLSKIFASLIMFIYNYLTNKLFVFNKNKI